MAELLQQKMRKPRVAVDGVLLLDKPAGLSSNDALMQAKRLFNAQKAGHTGTLDPFATGLLPLCFGEATKFAQDLLHADKTYEAIVQLGVCTTTGDTEGDSVSIQEVHVAPGQIEGVLAHFRGEIEQVPPMHSALKHAGKPLYAYARAGITIERPARRVTIRELAMLDYQAPFLSLRVTCSKGTYIRVLGEDIGALLGCGAHLRALHRTRVGALTAEHTVTLEHVAGLPEAERTFLLAPVDALLSNFPDVTLNDELAQRFLHGQRLPLGKEGIPMPGLLGRMRVYRENGRQLLGTGLLADSGVLSPERLIKTAGGLDKE